MVVFGPVNSRRLGLSLGINNIPPKHCSYACVYCQVGHTNPLQIKRQSFYMPSEIISLIKKKIALVLEQGQQIDYLTLVPDGEPTLDENLKDLMAALKPIGIPLAIISNGSLIDNREVQDALALADWVSLKVDSVDEFIWKKINRPHGALKLESLLQGMLDFSKYFSGQLVTETMLVSGINDAEPAINALGEFLKQLNPQKVYISLPIRPPCENWVTIPGAPVINRVYQQLSAQVAGVALMGEIDPHPFVSTSAFEEELLSTVAVHPLSLQTVQQMVLEAGESWDKVTNMVSKGRLQMVNYREKTFFLCGYQQRS